MNSKFIFGFVVHAVVCELRLQTLCPHPSSPYWFLLLRHITCYLKERRSRGPLGTDGGRTEGRSIMGGPCPLPPSSLWPLAASSPSSRTFLAWAKQQTGRNDTKPGAGGKFTFRLVISGHFFYIFRCASLTKGTYLSTCSWLSTNLLCRWNS